jgi:ribosomal protein S11
MNNHKQFGVWMDSHQATIAGPSNNENTDLVILAQVKGDDANHNSSEKNTNNAEKMVQAKFFKEICTHLVNATDVHVTGTGQAQEQFIHYLADTPQFKQTKTSESTSNKMSDENLIVFLSEKMKMPVKS